MDPLQEIVRSCEIVNSQAKYVSIDSEALEALIVDETQFPSDMKSMLSQIEWDSCGWHYNKDVKELGPLTAQYILVMDALNFCFWPNTQGLEYEHLAVNLKLLLESDPHSFDAERLEKLTIEEFQNWFKGWNFPLITERVLRLNEVGKVLREEFDGLAYNMIKRANNSASKLVSLITNNFPGFRDTTVFKGNLVFLYKRAQIFVADIWGAYGKPNDPSNPFYFYDIDKLTMFADYRVPQILNHIGVMKYSNDLLNKLNSKEEIQFGSNEEIEIRAMTIVAVEKIKQRLFEVRGIKLLSIEIDWLLWNWGEKVKDEIIPHHRTLTIYY